MSNQSNESNPITYEESRELYEKIKKYRDIGGVVGEALRGQTVEELLEKIRDKKIN